jgi:hypothetical protein
MKGRGDGSSGIPPENTADFQHYLFFDEGEFVGKRAFYERTWMKAWRG